MQLVHIERPDTWRRSLETLLNARNRAAEQVVHAMRISRELNLAITESLTERLQAGEKPAELRRLLVDAAVPPNRVVELLKAANGGKPISQRPERNPAQVEMFPDAQPV